MRLLVLMSSLLVITIAHADATPAEDRLRSALKQTTLDLRQAQDELATLRAQNAAMKQQLVTVQIAKKPAAPTADPRLQKMVMQQAAAILDLKSKLEEQQRLSALAQNAARDQALALHAREAELTALQQRIEPVQSAEKICRDRNRQLVDIGNRLLDRYKNKGVFESLADAEPFTRIHRIQLEALAQDEHAKIIDNTLPATADR